MRSGWAALTTVQAALGVAAALLPWSGNAIGGPSSRPEVLTGASWPVAVGLWLAAPAVALEAPAAVRAGWWWPVAGLACSAGAVVSAVNVVVTVYGSTVRAYQVDSSGNVGEPEAMSHPGPGLWCALALCLVTAAVHGVVLARRPRA